MQGWHLLSKNPPQGCLSNGSNDQIKQDLAEQHHQLHSRLKFYQSLVTAIFLLAVKHGPCLLTEKKIQAFKTECQRKLLHIYYLSIGPKIGCGARSAPLWVQRNLFWQLSRDGNLHGLSMSHAMTASPKPSFRAPWRVGDAVVDRGKD